MSRGSSARKKWQRTFLTRGRSPRVLSIRSTASGMIELKLGKEEVIVSGEEAQLIRADLADAVAASLAGVRW